jgi:predicted metalloendopeptidase
MKITWRTAVIGALFTALSARGGIDPKNFNPAVKPQDDFYQYANGGWLATNPIPADYGSWGAFNEVDERTKKDLHGILDRTAAATGNRTQIEQQVGDFYASGMDEAAIEAAGLKPLQPELDKLAAIQTAADVQAAMGHLQRMGVGAGFYFSSEQDPRNTTMMIAANGQGGLGLPDRDYYFRDDEKSKKIREQYVTHIAKIFELAGNAPAAAQTAAQAVMQVETALAAGSKKREDLRDPIANYHKMSLAEVQKLTPHFDWAGYLATIGVANPGDIDVGQPEFLQAFDQELTAGSVDEWKAYLRWHLLSSSAPYLSKTFVDEDFDFYGRTLYGTPQMHDRWKRVLDAEDAYLGEALGQLYVAEFFPPESKARMLKLVKNVEAALHDRLETLEWMDEPTRAEALKKLAAFGVKIGYPDKWIDYTKLKVDRGPYVLNVLRAQEFDAQRELAKIGKPVDRTEWGMSPQTVNAYNNPTMNEIVFPAAILQPPFFDPKADDAVNYGGIGAVIGHEMTHSYDDQGRQYGPDGNLKDWWTPESLARFKQLAAGIVKQFDGYVAVDDLHINGNLTQGENIADLGGVKLAYTALEKELGNGPREKIDGFTPEQRFFLGWATVWRTNQRPETTRVRTLTDPHSPAPFRVNGPLSNLPEFAQAFEAPAGAPMVRSEAERVVIW